MRILNGVSRETDTDVHLLECSDDVTPTRNMILRSLTHQYQRLQKQNVAAGREAPLKELHTVESRLCIYI